MQVRYLNLNSLRGLGANFIYPLLGACKYGWKFAGSDINKASIAWASENIIARNLYLKDHIIGPLRLQKNPNNILEGVIYEDDQFDFTVCNPPFFGSEDDRKVRKSSVCPI